ncbi:MAG: RidA family protein [Candidatus Dormibacteraeota bacterium]|nr:RidA family protein [Candidatus Dormibacteraeota bacterium]MBO0760799.1 RidA family protein [Candidatus Dormibacteraeota bacterium]
MGTATYINPEGLHSSSAFTQVVRVPAGCDTVYVGGQNGVGPDGQVVGPGVAEQTRQALANLRTCLEATGASPSDVVKWTILIIEDVDPNEGFAAFGEVWPPDAAPPAITVATVARLGPPGAVVEIEAVAAVPAS